jgi:hypothetical protein
MIDIAVTSVVHFCFWDECTFCLEGTGSTFKTRVLQVASLQCHSSFVLSPSYLGHIFTSLWLDGMWSEFPYLALLLTRSL